MGRRVSSKESADVDKRDCHQLSNMHAGPNYIGRAFNGRSCEQTSMRSQRELCTVAKYVNNSPRHISLGEITFRISLVLLSR